MRYTRYLRCADPPPESLTDLTSAWSRARELPGGTLLLKCRFNSEQALTAAQALAGVIVLPSLQSPADRLPQAVQDWLAARGVTLEAGDTVLNAVRKLRDAHPGHFFDISLPD